MKTTSALLLIALALFAPISFAQTKTPATPEKMHQLYAEYWEENLRMNPIMATYLGDHRFNDRFGSTTSAQERLQERALAEKTLARLAEFDPSGLSARDRISYDLLGYRLNQRLEAQGFADYLMPLSQMGGPHQSLAQLGSGREAQPFNTVNDYENWLARVQGLPLAFDAMILDMREGIARGIVLPKALVRPTLPQIEAAGTADLSKNIYMGPVRNFPASFSAADKQRLSAAYTRMVQEQVVPAYARLLQFMREVYLPAARNSVGLGALRVGDLSLVC